MFQPLPLNSANYKRLIKPQEQGATFCPSSSCANYKRLIKPQERIATDLPSKSVQIIKD